MAIWGRKSELEVNWRKAGKSASARSDRVSMACVTGFLCALELGLTVKAAAVGGDRLHQLTPVSTDGNTGHADVVSYGV